MNIKELRIGNYITFSGTFITEINHAHFKNIIDIEINNEQSSYKPIPLTEEWLSKLGFTRDDDIDYRWYILDKSIIYDDDDNYVCIADSWEFGKRKYVHEMQNLYFALTGKELTIKH